MDIKRVSAWKQFGGELSVFDHASATTHTPMRFAVYLPPQAEAAPVPAVTFLSGLTCTWENVMTKAGLQRWASELGLAVIAPDTSPRGPGVPDDDAYDLGQGAGFYLTAQQAPWARHYKMDQYVIHELWDLIHSEFPLDPNRHGILGHSMGGHGAITLHLKYHEDRYKSCSAFAPITSPTQVPWGQKAFTAYLGEPNAHWEFHDATELVKRYQSDAHILIDTGGADEFLNTQLMPDVFAGTADAHGQALTSRIQDGYDHSYYFVSSFAEEHMRHHADVLLNL
ncbi:MAG: S-formylglutathione hydrolase [Pseudomonadota bacterium]